MRIKSVCVSLFLTLSLAACGESGTGGEAITFRLGFESVAPEGEDLHSFTVSNGWTIELQRAELAVGPVYLYTRAAPTASLIERARDLIVARAWAHSGFDGYDGGQVRGELLDVVVVDLLQGDVQWQEGLSGLAGPVRSASLELASVQAAPFLGGQAYMEGVARKDGQEVPFSGVLRLPDDPKVRRVHGLPVSLDLVNGGEVVVEIRPVHWFGRIDFSTLPEKGSDGAHNVSENSDAHRAWARGVGTFGAFSIR